MRTVLILLCSIVAGCATPEQIAARQAAEAEAQEQRTAAYTEGLARQCEGIGYQRQTDPWRQCILQLHGQNRSALQGAILQQYMNQQRPAYQPQRPRTPVQTNCTRDYWGNVNCTTY